MLAALFVHLGLWQAGKADLAEAMRARHAQRGRLPPQPIAGSLVQPQELQDAPVSVEGEFEPADQFYVDNRQEGGRPGVHVITPLKIKGSNTRILVNRGWVGWAAAGRGALPVVATPTGPVRVTGIASVPTLKKPLLMSTDKQQLAGLWFAADIARFAGEHPYPLQPILVLQDPGDGHDGFIRNWAPPEDRTARHRGYSMQWFGLTGVLIVFSLWAGFQRRPGVDAP